MDTLNSAAAERIALFLKDERDLTALRCTNRFWRDILTPDNDHLWLQLCDQRFGTHVPAAAGGVGAGAAPRPAERFRRLASLKQPVAGLETIVWLNNHYLQALEHVPNATFGSAVYVREVCWLELGGRFTGVLPGRYRVAWRIGLEPGGWLDQAVLKARPQPAAASDDAADVEPQEQGGGEGAGSCTTIVWDTLHALQERDGYPYWFEVAGELFDVRHLSTVAVSWEALSGAWKHGIVFDCVRLVRQEPPPEAHQQQQEQRAGLWTAARSVGASWLERLGSLLQR